MAETRHILVIGGGAVGLCTAHYLKGTGCDVTIVERGVIGEGASLHNAGLIVPSHFIPLAAPGMVMLGLRWMLSPESPLYIKPRLDPDLLTWLWQFALASTSKRTERAILLLRDMSIASLALYEDLASVRGMEFEFRKNGLLMLFRTAHGREGALKSAEQAVRIGIEARVLDRSRLHDLEPAVDFKAGGGVYYPGDAHLTPALFVECLREHLIAQGVRFIGSRHGFRDTPLGHHGGHDNGRNIRRGRVCAGRGFLVSADHQVPPAQYTHAARKRIQRDGEELPCPAADSHAP